MPQKDVTRQKYAKFSGDFAEQQPLLFHQRNLDDFDGRNGAVAVVGLDLGDAVDDIEALERFAEDGVLAVKLCAGTGILYDVELRAA